MDDFIFHKALKAELNFLIENSHKLGGVLCFHGLAGCGKTTFAKYYSHLVSKEVHLYDASSHIFDKGSASNILKQINETGRSLSEFTDEVKYNAEGFWNHCFIIDEWSNLSASRQNAYKVTLERVSKEMNALFILIINTSKECKIDKVLTSAILSRCQTVDFDIKAEHIDEVTELVKERYSMLDEEYIRKTLPDMRQIAKRAKLLS